ncbi:MAG: pantoate--beta-alanine ligase [Bacteroidia bacterium]
MIIINSIQQLKDHLNSLRGRNKTIGFVPTMGALHQGHISLINAAKTSCDVIVCSIFVNPTQFNDPADLEKYPRTLDADVEMLEKACCDIVFVPEVTEMYSAEELELKRQKVEDKSWTKGKKVDFGPLASVMEGAHRPGHFNGVAQVVSKLFRIVEPDKAYFGQKDFQQLAIIRSMVKQLEIPVEIIACPIMREPNGLAMSSRNERLTKEEREQAGLISKVLFKIKDLYKSKTVTELKAFAENEIKSAPQMQLEYIEIADAETLQPVSDFKQNKSVVVCIALKLGAVRLIDNVLLY